MTDQTPSEAGWHPDPRDPTMERWFDGESWTDDVRRRFES